MNILRKMSACLVLFFAAVPLLTAQNRFPKPDFTNGYKIPELSPLPSAASPVERLMLSIAPYLQYAVVAVLLIDRKTHV